MAEFITSLILYGFMAGVLGFIGKLIYDIQQSKKQDRLSESNQITEDEVNNFQKLAGIKPTNPNDELREILVKNNIIAKEQIVGELLKAAQNSEFPAPDQSIPMISAKLTTIDTKSYSDSDPLGNIPMSRVSKEAKQKMAEIAKQDISEQLEQNAEKFASIFPEAVEYTNEYFKPDYSDSKTKKKSAKPKVTKAATPKKKATKKKNENE
jgi:hypothetical protein